MDEAEKRLLQKRKQIVTLEPRVIPYVGPGKTNRKAWMTTMHHILTNLANLTNLTKLIPLVGGLSI